MKFHILNKKGDETLVVEEKNLAKEFDQLIRGGYQAATKTGQRVTKTSEIPDTLEELIFSKPLKNTGSRGN